MCIRDSSLGYIGIYEMTKLMKGVSHTDPVGREFAFRVMNYLRAKCDQWKEETGLGFALYGTPAESLCYRFARIDQELSLIHILQLSKINYFRKYLFMKTDNIITLMRTGERR